MMARLHGLVCKLLGHTWGYYFYWRCDGWLGPPHKRRECLKCGHDEAAY